MNHQAELINWLRNSYAMEKSMETALKKLIVHPSTNQALREQASMHCTITRQHAESVAACLKKLGQDASTLKKTQVQGLDLMAGTAFAKDERVKDVLNVFVTEHFEISCHNILRNGAAQLGHWDIVGICDDILFEEKRMTRWLEVHLPEIIASYIDEGVAMSEPADFDDLEDETEDGPGTIGLAEYRAHDRLTRWESFHLAQSALKRPVPQAHRQHPFQSN